MKRILALILILIFINNIMGGYIMLMIQKHYVRREMVEHIKKGIAPSEMTAITMTSKNKADFYWRDTHEFEYNGNMYDVVKTEILNPETTVYYCMTDHKEMQLLAKLEMQKNKNSKQDKNSPFKEVIKLFFKVETEKQGQLVLTHSKSSMINNKVDFYNSLPLEISSPPPNYM